jgi:hypothetical protein
MKLNDKTLQQFYDKIRKNSFILWLENKSRKIIPRDEFLEFLYELAQLEGFDELLELQKKYVEIRLMNKPFKLKEKKRKNIRRLQDKYIEIAYVIDEFLKDMYGKELVDDYYYYSENFYDEKEEEPEADEEEEEEENDEDDDEEHELGNEIEEFEMTDDDLNDHELDILFGLINF